MRYDARVEMNGKSEACRIGGRLVWWGGAAFLMGVFHDAGEIRQRRVHDRLERFRVRGGPGAVDLGDARNRLRRPRAQWIQALAAGPPRTRARLSNSFAPPGSERQAAQGFGRPVLSSGSSLVQRRRRFRRTKAESSAAAARR